MRPIVNVPEEDRAKDIGVRSLLRAGVPSAETVSNSNALAQEKGGGIGWCVQLCA